MKKNILSVLLVFALSANGFSQDCDDLMNTSMDHITGKIDAASVSDISLSDSTGDQLTIATAMRNNQLLISFKVTSSSSWCFDKTGVIYFIFKDKSQISFRNINEFNCDGLSMLKIIANTHDANQANTDQNLKALTAKIIHTIRLKAMHSFIRFDMSEADSNLLDKQLTCLTQLQTSTDQ